MEDLTEDYTPTPEPSQVLLAIQKSVGAMYGLLFLFGVVRPVFLQMFWGIYGQSYLESATVPFMVCMLAAVGMVYMDKVTRSLKDTRAIELWTMVALGVAPFSGYSYIALKQYLKLWQGAFISWPNFLIYAFGFYLPFIFLAGWVSYRYRRDEF